MTAGRSTSSCPLNRTWSDCGVRASIISWPCQHRAENLSGAKARGLSRLVRGAKAPLFHSVRHGGTAEAVPFHEPSTTPSALRPFTGQAVSSSNRRVHRAGFLTSSFTIAPAFAQLGSDFADRNLRGASPCLPPNNMLRRLWRSTG